MDQGQGERRSAIEGPSRIQAGQEINMAKIYDRGDGKQRTIIFGRSPLKFTPEQFKGENSTYAFLPDDRRISRSQLVIEPSAEEIIIKNPTENKRIWVSTESSKKTKMIPPGQGMSLPNNMENVRNLRILFGRPSVNEAGYQLRATSVSGSSTNALQKLRLE